MIWGFVSPAPHPKYLHTKAQSSIFFICGKIWILEEISSKTPYVHKGCIYWSSILERKHPLPKVSFDVIFGYRNFSKIYSQFLREFGYIYNFGTHFCRVTEFVLEVLYSKYGYSEGKMGRLTGFGGRGAPNMICGHQAHPRPNGYKNGDFQRFFSSGCAFGCKYFSARPTPQVHPPTSS